jgi:hypothetical protein
MAMKRNGYRWNTRNFMNLQRTLLAGAIVSLGMLSASSSFAFPRYKNDDKDAGSWCSECHGDFTDSTTTKGSVFPGNPTGDKHTMHRGSSYMNTECNLCHTSNDNNNPYMGSSDGTSNNAGLGCAGCHMELGLRAHHAANGVACHGPEGPPPEENVIPPYYGTADTNVDDPCNAVLAADTGENWTIGDFIGTDNDGDNLYDLADYSCGPLRMVEVVPEGNNLRVRWETAGGRSERVQLATVLTNGFSDVGSTVTISGVGIKTQEVVLVNGATGSEGFYQVRSDP